MGDGVSDVGPISFIVYQLRQSSFGLILVYVWHMFFLYFTYVYVYGCNYRHELSYKAPISGMVVILSRHYDVLLLSRSFVVNIATS